MTKTTVRILFFTALLFNISKATAIAPDTDSIESNAEDSCAVISDTIIRLTEADFTDIAKELNIEIAAIKAVVDIEAGTSHQGFFAPGLPLINFDLTMFQRFANRRGIKLHKYQATHAEVFSRPNSRRHGSTQAAQQNRFRQACSIDKTLAIESTFWGMFQIGGFNWKLCGCADINEFLERMSSSERAQLELFAKFITNTGIDKYLRTKNWTRFAQRYNGPSYASRCYHTRLAAAYRKHLNDKKPSPTHK